MLDVDAVIKILDDNGPLALAIKGFEARDAQRQMMRSILHAYNHNHIALIEAGTGTGKSMAYLIPALLWAAQTKERTVISTNTITLQEQLLHKDIPRLLKALNLDVKAVLVKGMHNYLCKRKFDDAQHEAPLFAPAETEEIYKIGAWLENVSDGSRSSMPFSVSHAAWEKVAAESDTCNRNACPYYQECCFFKARRQASEAQILIVNHHLLFADLVRRAESDNYKDAAILPPYTRIILDEAHNIEDVATEYFADHISQMDLFRLMARLASEKGGKIHGKLPLIKEKLTAIYRHEMPSEVSAIHSRLAIDLPGLRRDLQQLSHETFGAFFDFAQLVNVPQKGSSEEPAPGDHKLRILPKHHQHPFWIDKLVPIVKQLIGSIQRYAQGLVALEQDIKYLDHPRIDDQFKSTLFEISALAARLSGAGGTLEQFIGEQIPPNKVRWIELQMLKSMLNTTLVDANLDIAKTLANYLFSKFPTIVLCSATLTTNNQFRFFRNRLGLTEALLPGRAIKENIYNSPFNFPRQAMLAVPTDIPSPSEPSFTREASEHIWRILQASRGNAFVLFTSYTMLQACFALLETRLKEQRFHPIKQGDEDRLQLLKRFQSQDRSVLFGTDSFWEGVDVVGDALRCVIIVKLPFKVPSDPLIQARSEAITEGGGDPFMDYSLPQAIVKFKQGFGRLIRNKRDRGCIVCLDNRLMTKRYGRMFLNSLPACQQAFVPSEELKEKMGEFYRKTHFLTKS